MQFRLKNVFLKMLEVEDVESLKENDVKQQDAFHLKTRITFCTLFLKKRSRKVKVCARPKNIINWIGRPTEKQRTKKNANEIGRTLKMCLHSPLR